MWEYAVRWRLKNDRAEDIWEIFYIIDLLKEYCGGRERRRTFIDLYRSG